MALSKFDMFANTITGLKNWFADIYNHLCAKNYDNNEWTPVITGMIGTPQINAWYQRWGQECNFKIEIAGTHLMLNAEISLPIEAHSDGIAEIISNTDNSFLGTGRIDKTTQKLKIASYWVTNETVIIIGYYITRGI